MSFPENHGAEPVFFSAGSTDITPPAGVPLAGYGDRDKTFDEVADKLEVNAAVLIQGNTRIIFLSADLLFVTHEIKEVIAEALGEAHGIDVDNIFFGSSHTHFAPSVDPAKPLLGLSDSGYISFFLKKLIQLIEELLDGAKTEIGISYQCATAQHSVNRRRWGWLIRPLPPKKQMLMAPEVKGAKDENLHVFSIRNGNKLEAVIWVYACHPVNFPEKNKVSADYIGVVREKIRKLYPGVTVLFFQGFSGNIRPKTEEPSRWKYLLRKKLGLAIQFYPMSLAYYQKWSASLAELVAANISVTNKTLVPQLSIKTAAIELNELIPAQAGQVRFMEVSLSENIRILSLSAEVVSEYKPLLENMYKGKTLVPVGCEGGVFGYLPTNKMLVEGGYEAEGFMAPFGLSGKFTPDIEGKIKKAVSRLHQV